jgi:hypothetical protein
VDVHVQAAGQDKGAGGVEFPAAVHGPAELGDPPVADPDIALRGAARGDHGAAADDQVELAADARLPAGDHKEQDNDRERTRVAPVSPRSARGRAGQPAAEPGAQALAQVGQVGPFGWLAALS